MTTTRSACDGNSLDAFLKHKGSLGGGSKFLKGWTEKGKLYAWLHTLQLPIGLWRHQFPTLVVREDRTTRKVEKHIWGQSYNCHETEEVLLRQNFRDKNTGEREALPTRCPFCRFIEWVYQEVKAGNLSWVDPILRFEGADNPKENQVIHAGGIYNAFADYGGKLTDDQKAEMKKAGIYPSEAWKENGKAKLSYVFTLVNNDDVANGVQVTIENQALGDKVKSVINDRLESAGVEAGNPQINPYCIEFTYNEKESFDAKYHARYIEKIKLTDEIEKLLRSDPPDLAKVIQPFDKKSFRAMLERALVVKAPLDEIFDVEEDEEESDGDEDFPHGANAPEEPEEKEAPKAETKKTGGRRARVPHEEPKPEEIPPEELGPPCDNCKAPMRKTDLKCGACGMEYEEEDEDSAEDAPPPKEEAKAESSATSACRHCKHVSPKKEKKCPKCGKKKIPF